MEKYHIQTSSCVTMEDTGTHTNNSNLLTTFLSISGRSLEKLPPAASGLPAVSTVGHMITRSPSRRIRSCWTSFSLQLRLFGLKGTVRVPVQQPPRPRQPEHQLRASAECPAHLSPGFKRNLYRKKRFKAAPEHTSSSAPLSPGCPGWVSAPPPPPPEKLLQLSLRFSQKLWLLVCLQLF